MSAQRSVSLALLLLSASAGAQDSGSAGRMLGAPASEASPWTVTTDPSGELRWTLHEAQAPQRESTRLVVDSAPPTVAWRIEGPTAESADGQMIVHPDTRLVAVAEDPAGASIEQRRFDGEALARWPAPLPEGSRTLAVLATDGIGNQARAEQAVLVDGQGPELTVRLLSELDGAPGYSARPARLAVNASDALTTARIIASAGGADCPAPDRCEFSSEDSELTLVAEDELGNRTEQRATWRFDEAPPTATLTYEGRAIPAGELVALSVGDAVGFELTDEGVGVRSAVYRYNEIEEKPVPETLRFLTRGRYLLLVRTEDRVGNRGEQRWTVVAR